MKKIIMAAVCMIALAGVVAMAGTTPAYLEGKMQVWGDPTNADGTTNIFCSKVVFSNVTYNVVETNNATYLGSLTANQNVTIGTNLTAGGNVKSATLNTTGAGAIAGAFSVTGEVTTVTNATVGGLLKNAATFVYSPSTMTGVVPTNFPVCVSSNSPLYWRVVIGVKTCAVPAYEITN